MKQAVVIQSSANMDVKNTTKKYSCDRCGNSFKTNHKWSLLRHIKNIHEGDVNQVTFKEEKLQENSKNLRDPFNPSPSVEDDRILYFHKPGFLFH